MLDYENLLNSQQYSVVKMGDGPCLVLAGAGSGKTRTIVHRVAYLLEKGIDPSHILLVTFTNKAAKEMQHRVAALLGKDKQVTWSGTFHHIAFRILKQYAALLGYQNNFSILDSEDAKDLMKVCLKLEGVDRKSKRFPSAKVLQGIISYARNAEMTIEDVLELKHPNWSVFADDIARIATEYKKRKMAANAMDFDDLLTNLLLLLLQSQPVREKLSKQFEYILVDEYQDTNKIQANIIDVLASHHKNILVVGDDAQSIYSFRAADIDNILQFEHRFPDAKIFKLETNYRSTPNILDVANTVIAQNTSQFEKNLQSVGEYFTKPEVQAFADKIEEAEFVADRILELRDEGVPINHMAVLFRASHLSQVLEVELTKRDIPYDYRGGVRFFERSHIKDILAYLRIFHNKDDAIAWSRVLNMQVGIGPASAQKIIDALQGSAAIGAWFDGEDLGRLGSKLSSRGQVGWNDFLQIFEIMEAVYKKYGDIEKVTPSDLIDALLDSKYTEYLESEYDNYRDRMKDIEQLSDFAAVQTDLGKFLGEASMQESFQGAVTDKTHVDDEGKLVMSTIHQAKGLEWEAVFILGVAQGDFPNERALREDKGLEEERRLFYVAITRARKYLHMTYPLVGSFRSVLGGPSMFLQEIDKDLIEEIGAFGAETVFSDPSDDVDDIEYVPEGEIFDYERNKRSFLKSLDEL
ncbi:ATP-dependent helicase [Candidatus Nomurabacteria bacterium]|nr:ATP-dependent helicase [Candidatus Nomurabacteria bacterium]